MVDKNVTMTCPVHPDTDPPPSIVWYMTGQQLQEDQRVFVSDNGRILTLTRAKVADEARYRCVATNVAGEIDKMFDLEVQGRSALQAYSFGGFFFVVGGFGGSF